MTSFQVITFDSRGKRIDAAEAATPEDALFAGQTLWDEARGNTYGAKPSLGFYDAEGKLIRMVYRRPEGTA